MEDIEIKEIDEIINLVRDKLKNKEEIVSLLQDNSTKLEHWFNKVSSLLQEEVESINSDADVVNFFKTYVCSPYLQDGVLPSWAEDVIRMVESFPSFGQQDKMEDKQQDGQDKMEDFNDDTLLLQKAFEGINSDEAEIFRTYLSNQYFQNGVLPSWVENSIRIVNSLEKQDTS